MHPSAIHFFKASYTLSRTCLLCVGRAIKELSCQSLLYFIDSARLFERKEKYTIHEHRTNIVRTRKMNFSSIGFNVTAATKNRIFEFDSNSLSTWILIVFFVVVIVGTLTNIVIVVTLLRSKRNGKKLKFF